LSHMRSCPAAPLTDPWRTPGRARAPAVHWLVEQGLLEESGRGIHPTFAAVHRDAYFRDRTFGAGAVRGASVRLRWARGRCRWIDSVGRELWIMAASHPRQALAAGLGA
jgi:hypothetical protein